MAMIARSGGGSLSSERRADGDDALAVLVAVALAVAARVAGERT